MDAALAAPHNRPMQSLIESAPPASPARGPWLRVVLVGAVLAAFGAGLLWARFGAVVFHEILAAGIAVCF